MPSIAHQLFENSPVLHVRDVTLGVADDLGSHREKLARVMLDKLYQFVALLDVDGNVIEVNRTALEFAGIELDEIQGKPFWDVRCWPVSEETRALQQDFVRRARAGEFVRRDFEIYGQARGTKKIFIDFSLAPVRDNGRKIVFLLAEGRDISDKKHAEAEIAKRNEELRGLLDELRRLDQLKTDFFANVSHDLRTPLALILNLAAALAKGGNLTGEQQRDISAIERNSRTMHRHVNELLDIAKIDAAKYTVNYARIDLACAVRTTTAHFDSLARQRSLSYEVITPGCLEQEVDPEKFDRILLNLLSNAFKFTPDGGRIQCTLGVTEQDCVELTVLDSGPGVKPELREDIFERFRQIPGGMTGDFGGTGLGLVIAKEFVQLHGGTIAVSNGPVGGALFRVELPGRAPTESCAEAPALLNRDHAPASYDERGMAARAVMDERLLMDGDELETPDEAGSPERPLILVSEDHPDMRRFVTEILRGDYRVVAAADGASALEKAMAEPPDLVVTDLMLPKLGGDRLVAEMRADDRLAHVPILVLSANADEELRLKLLAESVQDYIVKPFSAPELRARVRNLVAMKRTRDALQKELASQNEDLSQLAEQLIRSQQALRHSLDTLAASEERWRAVFENSPAGIALTTSDGRIEASNGAYQRMLGFSDEELNNLSLFDITHEDDREASRALLTDLLQHGNEGVRQAEGRYRRKDGNVIWGNLSLSLIPRRGRGPEYAIVISEDITRRKRVERLRDYERIVEGLQEMILVVDRDYRYLIANRAYLSYRGLEKEQLIGQFVADWIQPGVFENIAKQKLDECFGGSVVSYEIRHAYPGQSERDLSISYFPIEGANGIDRVACVFQDITERKKSEAALRALSGRLLRLEDDERRRLARELHDSSAQLLAALCMNLSVVNESAGILNPRAKAAMAESITVANCCLREIRTVSYLLHPRELDELGLESALSLYIDGFIQRSGIRAEIEVSPDLGRLPQAVETVVFRVVQECLTNIHRHSGSSTARLRLIRGPSNLVLEVADAGHGIRPGGPSGIGIASMRERLQQIEGSLEIASHSGGTTVKATIPLSMLPV